MDANTKYLTLALDVRAITDSLIDFVEEGKELQKPNKLLRSFMNSLTEQPGVSVKNLSDMGSFGSYESLKTINELFDSTKRKVLTEKLRAVSNPSSRSRQNSALEAITILDTLERTALYHYEHTGPESKLAIAS
jgi:hypothetical protein